MMSVVRTSSPRSSLDCVLPREVRAVSWFSPGVPGYEGARRSIDMVRSETARKRRQEGEDVQTVDTRRIPTRCSSDGVRACLRDALALLLVTRENRSTSHFFCGLAYKDVAEIESSRGTVKSRIRAGLRHFRRMTSCFSFVTPKLVARR